VLNVASFALEGRTVWVAGHGGMVGQALLRRLKSESCTVLTSPRSTDLRDQRAVDSWFADNRPDAVIVAAARVGGILANSTRPAEFLFDNLAIATTVIDAACRYRTGKLLYLGSSCIYPKLAEQPIPEDALLTGPLEPTNEAYGIAKIAGLKLAAAYRRQYGCDFISAMPTNLYGPGDNWDPQSGHVVPALIRKAHEAKEAEAAALAVWGTGTPRREFLYVDDLADACIRLLVDYSEEAPINIGYGEDIAIGDLATMIARTVGFTGRIEFDTTKPDGTPRKLLDSTRMRALGWQPTVAIEEGLMKAYAAFLREAA
jgi:GDP-L-fucose synthase